MVTTEMTNLERATRRCPMVPAGEMDRARVIPTPAAAPTRANRRVPGSRGVRMMTMAGPQGGRRRPPRRPRIDPANTRPATPYLVIRSFDSDLGVRPLAPAEVAATAFSPDIPFVPEETPDGSLILSCWVSNMGFAPAAPVQVEFFLMPPSITQPSPSPFLVATEYTVIQPHTSKLVRSRPLTFPNPFGGGLAQGVVVRAGTTRSTGPATRLTR